MVRTSYKGIALRLYEILFKVLLGFHDRSLDHGSYAVNVKDHRAAFKIDVRSCGNIMEGAPLSRSSRILCGPAAPRASL